MPLHRYSLLVQAADIILNSVGVNYKFHLGGDTYVETADKSDKILFSKYDYLNNVRALVVDESITLTTEQFVTLVSKMADIEASIPELTIISPCYLRDDHKNIYKMFPKCNECCIDFKEEDYHDDEEIDYIG